MFWVKSCAWHSTTSARRLIENMETDKPHLNEQYSVDKAIDKACFLLERIDRKLPAT